MVKIQYFNLLAKRNDICAIHIYIPKMNVKKNYPLLMKAIVKLLNAQKYLVYLIIYQQECSK